MGDVSSFCFFLDGQITINIDCIDIDARSLGKMVFIWTLNRNLPLAIEETMAAIVRKIQLFCISLLKVITESKQTLSIVTHAVKHVF